MKEETGKYRPQICDIVSEMLDNPDEYGIYGTTILYEKLDNLIYQAIDSYKQELLEKIDELPSYFLRVNEDGTAEMVEEKDSAYLHIADIKTLIEKDKV